MVDYSELRNRRRLSIFVSPGDEPKLPGIARTWGFQPLFDHLWARLAKAEERDAEILASLDMLHEKVANLAKALLEKDGEAES